MRKRFEVIATRYVVVDIDDSLMPDDEWRATFYDCKSLGQLAEHIVHNLVVRQFDQVEGLLPEEVENKVAIINDEVYLTYEHRQL